MFKNSLISRVWGELTGFSKSEQVLMLTAILCLCCVTMIYSICRPISNSFFVSSYGPQFYPWAWLAVVPFNYLAVSLFNRFVSKLGCLRLFMIIIGLIISFDFLASFMMDLIKPLPFIYYVWKEVYILLLFHQTWAVIHASVNIKKAKYLYGIFFSLGGLGGLLGSYIVTKFAVSIGSGPLLLTSVPCCLTLAYLYYRMTNASDVVDKSKEVSDVTTSSKVSLQHGMNLIMRSKLLICILGIVIFMQLATALIDFQFYSFLEKAFATKDLRTAYAARAFLVVNYAKIPLQLFGTALFVKVVGLKKTHLVSPFILLGQMAFFLFVPTFSVISSVFISLKTLDFSVFGISKEMLYVRLSAEEKFQAKSVIDVFAYRSAKAIGSLFILLLTRKMFAPYLSAMTHLILLVLAGWVVFVLISFRKEWGSETEQEALPA